MTRADGTDGFNEEMGWLPGYEGGGEAGDGFDTVFYAEAASAREYAQRYGEDGQAQRERALKQLEGTGYEELVMQGLQAEQNSAYREKAAAFLESFMKGEYIPDVQLGELWQSAQAWNRQRTQAENRQDTAVQTAGANTAEGLTVGESRTEGKGYASAGEMLGEWAEGAGGAKKTLNNGHLLDDMAELYAKNVNSNGKWSWMDDFPDASGLSKANKASIKKLAIEKGLIQDIPIKTVTDSARETYRYANFDLAGVVKQKVDLPENLWKKSDVTQFKWLDEKIGGRP